MNKSNEELVEIPIEIITSDLTYVGKVQVSLTKQDDKERLCTLNRLQRLRSMEGFKTFAGTSYTSHIPDMYIKDQDEMALINGKVLDKLQITIRNLRNNDYETI